MTRSDAVADCGCHGVARKLGFSILALFYILWFAQCKQGPFGGEKAEVLLQQKPSGEHIGIFMYQFMSSEPCPLQSFGYTN